MLKTPTGRHLYNVLLSLGLIAVMLVFQRDIPWFAWVGAFIFYLVMAEIFSWYLYGNKDASNEEAKDIVASRSKNLLVFSAIMAAVLVIILLSILL